MSNRTEAATRSRIDELKDTGREFDGLEPVRGRVAKEVRSVVSLRLSASEFAEISEVAGKNVSDFIRRAALEKARLGKDQAEPQRTGSVVIHKRGVINFKIQDVVTSLQVVGVDDLWVAPPEEDSTVPL